MAAAFWALAFASLHLVQGECDYHARIDAGSEQTCGIENTTDVVHCWGDMQADSCSSGDVDYHSEFDVAQAARPRFKQVSAGRFHACGITLANDMRCWGTGKKAEPRAGKFKQVSASRYWNCAIRGQSVLWDPSQEDTLLCWGDEDGRNAELGKPPTDKFRSVNMGREYGCGIRLDNTVACWGPCYDETCGSQVPTGSFRSISTGEDFACAISLETDMAKCWGALNTSGIPANAPDDPFVEIGVGKNFVCGVKQIDKTIMCWADNDNHIIFRDLPEGTFADVTCGGAHACASNDNEVRCWGEESGQGETVPPPFFKICPRGPPLIADDVPASTVGSGMSHGSVALLVVLMGLACGILGAFLAVAAIRRQCGFDMAGRFVGRHHNRYSMDDDLERPDL